MLYFTHNVLFFSVCSNMQPFVACTCMRTGRTDLIIKYILESYLKSSITTKFICYPNQLSVLKEIQKKDIFQHIIYYFMVFFVCRLNVGNENSKTKNKEDNSHKKVHVITCF